MLPAHWHYFVPAPASIFPMLELPIGDSRPGAPFVAIRLAFLQLVLCVPSLLSVRAQATAVPPTAARVDEILSSINRARFINQVAVSPDGKRLAWSQNSQIRVAPLGDLDHSQPVTAASEGRSCADSDFTWSPDSSSIAFFSDCADPGGQSDLYLSHLDVNLSVRLSHLHGYLDAPAFSPDGKRIAFLYVEGATRPAGALAAMDLPSGVIGEDHIEVQRVAQIAISSPFDCEPPALPDKRPQGSQGSCLGGLFSFLTPPSLHVYEFDWSPDSKSLAYVAADPPGENNWWLAKLYTQILDAPAPDFWTEDTSNARSGESASAGTSRTVTLHLHSNPYEVLNPSTISGPLHGLQIAEPRWSPDGQSIAFIGGLMSDQGATGGDVWIVPSIGGQPRDLTPNRLTSAQWIAWDGNGQIDVHELAGGNCQLVRFRLQSGPTGQAIATGVSPPVFTIPALASADRLERDLSTTADRSLFVFAAGNFNLPPEIYAARPAAPPASTVPTGFPALTQLSRFNASLKPSWGDSVSLTWTNDSFHIQGWLLLPVHYDPSKKYPLIVEVHGGPAAAALSRWSVGGPFSPLVLSELGYFVLLPNPRGSFGQGEAFTQANRKDFGYGDLRDILSGIDTVLSAYPVDPKRIGIDGWSYGGFMTMFAVTQSHRFRAAVAGAGISDWLSYYGENSIDQWMIPYFGASVYDDPAVYQKSSPLTFAKQAQTPTLALVGDRDGECPAPQSFEFWHALRDLHVPAQLVVYPNEGHGLADPAHRRDVLVRTVDWFFRYMPPSP